MQTVTSLLGTFLFRAAAFLILCTSAQASGHRIACLPRQRAAARFHLRKRHLRSFQRRQPHHTADAGTGVKVHIG